MTSYFITSQEKIWASKILQCIVTVYVANSDNAYDLEILRKISLRFHFSFFPLLPLSKKNLKDRNHDVFFGNTLLHVIYNYS